MRMMIPALACAILLAACDHNPGPPPAMLVHADRDWMQRAAPLPDIPACRGPDEASAASCRSRYDEQARRMYAALGNNHNALVGHVEKLEGSAAPQVAAK